MGLHERSIIANQKFIYKKEKGHLSGKLKYFQHRNDRDTHIKQRDEHGQPIRRWVDRGLGDTYAAIARTCTYLATTGLSSEVGARTLVLSPQVEFMQALPPDRREAVMAELTEATVDSWFEKMNLPTAEYAFVVHQGEVKNDRPGGVEQDDRAFTHSHVVLAATVQGMEGRENYKVYKEQLKQLHAASAEEMERIWTRELGPERVEELNQQLEDLTAQLRDIDDAREQAVIEQVRPDQKDLDETMLEVYAATGMEPPRDLLERVYEAREQAREQDPAAALRALGFDIPKDDDDLLQQLQDLGFDVGRGDDPLRDDMKEDILELARGLGLDLPTDDIEIIRDEDIDLLQAYRDLGFIIPDDELDVDDDSFEELAAELRGLGFAMPTDRDDIDLRGDIEDDRDTPPDIDIDMD